MGIAPQHLFKRNLIHDTSMIKPARTVGERDLPAAPQPRGHGGNFRRVGEQALRRQEQIVVHRVPFQRGQAAGAAGDIGEGRTFSGYCHRRLLQHMNPIFRAFYAVPGKPVVHREAPLIRLTPVSAPFRAAAVWSAPQSQPPGSEYPGRPAPPSAVPEW